MTLQIIKQANGSIDLVFQADGQKRPTNITLEPQQVGTLIKMLQLAQNASDFEFLLKL